MEIALNSIYTIFPYTTLFRSAVSGWAADNEDGSPVAKVEIRIDGTAVGNATLGFSRQDVADALNGLQYADSGVRCSLHIDKLAPGTHTVTAVAFDSIGASTQL